MQAGLHLLVCGQTSQIDRRDLIGGKWNSPSDQATVIAPVEGKPGQVLERLILEMRCLLELLVMVNAEGEATGCNRGS